MSGRATGGAEAVAGHAGNHSSAYRHPHPSTSAAERALVEARRICLHLTRIVGDESGSFATRRHPSSSSIDDRSQLGNQRSDGLSHIVNDHWEAVHRHGRVAVEDT